MKVSQLRDLTRKFAAGGMPEDEYRRERAKLIDGIVNGDISPRYREIHPAELSKPQARHGRSKLLAIGSAALLIALLVTALLVQFMSPAATNSDTRDTTAARTQAEPGVLLLRDFLQEDTWDDASLEAMENEWNALSGFEREAARSSHLYRRLKAQTESHIREYEALADGNPEALLQAARLRMFAERLNFTPET